MRVFNIALLFAAFLLILIVLATAVLVIVRLRAKTMARQAQMREANYKLESQPETDARTVVPQVEIKSAVQNGNRIEIWISILNPLKEQTIEIHAEDILSVEARLDDTTHTLGVRKMGFLSPVRKLGPSGSEDVHLTFNVPEHLSRLVVRYELHTQGLTARTSSSSFPVRS